MEIVCKDIIYDFISHPDYDKALALAEKNIEKLYLQNRKDELEEAREMLEDGAIDSLDDYDYEYADDFDKAEFQGKIVETADEYMCNYLDLPKKIVVDIDAEKSSDISLDELKSAAKSFCGAKIADIKTYDKASNKDIWEQKSYEAIGNMQKNGDYKTFLDLKSSLSNYSTSNICMIYTQKPDAKAVMGFKSWSETYDRQINKGEKQLKIWCPSRRVLKTEKNVDDYLDYTYFTTASKEKEKERLMEEIKQNGSVKVVTGFNLGGVFDISQTTCRDPQNDKVGDMFKKNNLIGKNLENYDEVITAVFSVMKEDVVRISGGMSEQDELFEMIRQYSDKILSEKPESILGIKSKDAFTGNKHKLETEIATSLICEHIGIDCNEKTAFIIAQTIDSNIDNQFEYGKRKMFLESFDRGSKLAKQFITELDKELPKDIKKAKTINKEESSLER